MTPRRLLIVILIVYAGLAALTAAAQPLWGGHEADYYTVTRFLVANGRLPTETDYPAGDAEIRQATQPPLYFLLAAPALALIDDGQVVPPGAHPPLICPAGEADHRPLLLYPPTEDYAFPPSGAALGGYALRVVGIVFGLGTIAAVYGLGRALFPARPAVAVAGAALLACEPSIIQLTVTISNDGLLLLIAAVNLLALAKLITTGRPIYAGAVLLTGALAVVARLQGWAVFALDGLTLAAFAAALVWRLRHRASRRTLIAVLGGGVTLVAAGIALAAFNYAQYGSVFGRYELLDRLIAEAASGFSVSAATFFGIIDHTRLSFLEPLDALSPPRFVRLVYLALPALLIGLSVVATVAAIGRRRHRAAFALLIGAIGLAWALVIFRTAIFSTGANTTRYNTAFIFAPIRYYAPALPALAVLFAAAVFSLLPTGAAGWARLIRAGGRLTVSAIALVWGMVALLNGLDAAARPTVPTVALSDLPQAAPPPAGEVRLLAYEVTPRPAEGRVALTLYAQADTALSYYADLRLGTSPCQTLPARGEYPTFRWPPDRAVRLDLIIPYCGAPTTDPPLTLTWVGADMTGTVVTQGAVIDLGRAAGAFVPAAACPPIFGTIDGFRASGFNSPSSVGIGETYVPSANWIIDQANPAIGGRLFVFEQQTTLGRYGCAEGTHVRPPSAWQTGEYVYFDGCPFTFPAEAVTGMYTVYVGLTDAAGMLLPGVGADGAPLAEGLIPLGTVEVVGSG